MRALSAAIAAAVLAACAPSATTARFDSPNPAARLYAIQRAGEHRDRSALPQLVKCLESDDPAERMLAIQALQRIHGDRLGYRPYGTPAQRQQAVSAWLGVAQSENSTAAAAPPTAAVGPESLGGQY